jgi:hypothetical protein
MKSHLVLALILAAAVRAAAADVSVGDPRDRVVDELGRPLGSASRGSIEVMYYERGYVELVDGRVTVVKLVSKAQAAENRRADEARAQDAARAHQERVRLAEEEIRRLQADASFRSLSAKEQVARWQDLKKEYPEATLPAEYDQALATVREEEQAAAAKAALAAAEEKPKPVLSASKRRKMIRYGRTNMVDRAESP